MAGRKLKKRLKKIALDQLPAGFSIPLSSSSVARVGKGRTPRGKKFIGLSIRGAF